MNAPLITSLRPMKVEQIKKDPNALIIAERYLITTLGDWVTAMLKKNAHLPFAPLNELHIPHALHWDNLIRHLVRIDDVRFYDPPNGRRQSNYNIQYGNSHSTSVPHTTAILWVPFEEIHGG